MIINPNVIQRNTFKRNTTYYYSMSGKSFTGDDFEEPNGGRSYDFERPVRSSGQYDNDFNYKETLKSEYNALLQEGPITAPELADITRTTATIAEIHEVLQEDPDVDIVGAQEELHRNLGPSERKEYILSKGARFKDQIDPTAGPEYGGKNFSYIPQFGAAD